MNEASAAILSSPLFEISALVKNKFLSVLAMHGKLSTFLLNVGFFTSTLGAAQGKDTDMGMFGAANPFLHRNFCITKRQMERGTGRGTEKVRGEWNGAALQFI